jgi:hypothetical protein
MIRVAMSGPGSGVWLGTFAMIEQPQRRITPSTSETESSAETLLMMGHILSSWQGVEHAIFELFLAFFAEDHADVAALSFFAVRTFEARTQLVDALVLHYGTNAQQSSWEKLAIKIRKKSKRRNAVAHGLICFYGKRPNRESVIGRSIFDISKFPGEPRKKDFVSAKEMKEASFAFMRLAEEIYKFSDRLISDTSLLSRLRAPSQQVKENSRRYPLRAQIPTAQPPPRGPSRK